MNDSSTAKQNPDIRRYGLISSFILILPILMYWQTAWSMVEIWWRSETFTHGFLILPISLYLIWQKRDELSKQPVNCNFWGLIPLALCGVLWFLANLVDISVIQQLMFTAMFPVLVLILFGWSVTRTILFPLCFLIFMVPFGERLVPSLIEFTAFFTIRSIELTGIPIYWEGTHLSLPSGNWSVVEACSGIRYLIASIALGSLYCYITFRSFIKRSVFFGLFIIVPVLANGMRAFMIVMIGHFSSMKLATGVDHLIYGWVFFGIVMFVMFYIGSFFSDESPSGAEVDEEPKTDQLFSTVNERYTVSNVAVALALCLVVVWPLVARQEQISSDTEVVSQLSDLPAQLGGWQLESAAITDWHPIYQGTTAEIHVVYRKADQRIGLFLEHYPHQRQNAELVNSQNVLVEERSIWKQVENTVTAVSDIDGLTKVKQARLKSNTQNLLVWNWYHLAGMNTVSDYLGKLYGVYGKLLKGDESATGVILYMEYEDSLEQQQQSLSAFSALLLPWLGDSQ